MRTTRKFVFFCIAGVITAFAFTAGYLLDNFDTLDFMDSSFYKSLLPASIIASIITYVVWEVMSFIKKKGFFDKRHFIRKPSFLFSVILMFLCWIPTWLSIFPGVFSYDAYDEWQQIVNGVITSHHPVIHVVLLGGLVEGIHTLTGSYNAGIAVYTVLQMLILAHIFALSIRLLDKYQKVSVVWQYAALAFYCLSPVVQLFSICATKDVLFAAAQLLFLQYVLIFYENRNIFFKEKSILVGFVISAFFTMTMRNNGFYIVLIICVIMCFSIRKMHKAQIQTLTVVMLLAAVSYGIYTGPIYSMLDVKKGGVEEMLSVPLQQMARVYKYDYASLDQNDLELLYEIVPQTNLEAYRPTVSDFVKSGFQREAFAQHKIDFLRLWLKWGLEHPLTYINSFLINTVDGWYPKAVIDGYRNEKNNYYDYHVAEPGTEIVLLPKLHAYYDAISHDKAVQQNGWSFLILSPGWFFILFIHLFLYTLCQKRYTLIVPMLIPLLNFLTVLLGPMALVRYVLIFFYAFPVMLSVCLTEQKTVASLS